MQIYRYKAQELKYYSSPIKWEGRIFLWYFSRSVVQSIPSKIGRDFLRPKIGHRLQAGSGLPREWLIGAQTAICSLVSLWQIEVEGITSFVT